MASGKSAASSNGRESEASMRAVGPYLLQRTLGKGQTGLVRLGVHCVTRKTVAVKMINREKLSKSVLLKVEREIAIMKLIDHPHVLGLYDVYENNTHLYLVLEHVSGGELFDYLVRKGRLSEREARRFFRQIVSAVDFCHKHKICHRDLKPENLLLDENKNIKVADFGMASLQVGERLLETSCGSPHYACPEVIRGEQYDGRKADVWSCGVILYALLVGALPFDDDNLRQLLEKVKMGQFHIPSYVPAGAQQLLRDMVQVNPRKRLSLDQVIKHSWFRGSSDIEAAPSMQEAVEVYTIHSRSDIDPDVFKSMTSLGCFKDKSALTQALLKPEPNEEKIIYFLLLSRKERQPSVEDETTAAPVGHREKDPPRKRVDSRSASSPQLYLQRARSQSIGSANLDQIPSRSPRLSVATTPNYSPSATGYYTYTSATPPLTKGRKVSYAGTEAVVQGSSTLQVGVPAIGGGGLPPGSPWKRKLSKTMKHLVVSPRFHRKRYEASEGAATEGSGTSSPQLPKRSWFANFLSEREKSEVVSVFRDKSFSELKASLFRAFDMVNCTFEEVAEHIFKLKYEKSAKQKGKTVFKKPVKLTLTVMPTQTTPSTGELNEAAIVFDGKTFTVTFTQTAGPTRRFRRVCEKLEAAIVNPSTVNPLVHEMADFGINPSLSSDDTLAANEGEEPAISEQNGERSHGAPRELLESYDSTEDESEEAQTSILY